MEAPTMNEAKPEAIDTEKTEPQPRKTMAELVFGDDDRFADDVDFRDDLKWDRGGR
jgi:hypothetical protein